MDHEKYKELVYLFSIGEADDKEKEIRKHLSVCTSCRKELEEHYILNRTFQGASREKLDEGLLLAARTELKSKLKYKAKRSGGRKVTDKIIYLFTDNYRALLQGAAGIAAGLLLGFVLFKSDSSPVVLSSGQELTASAVPVISSEDISQLRNIKLVDVDPFDNHIELSFDVTRQVSVSGSLNDENIKNLLLYAVLNGNNPGVRLNSLNLLNASSEMSTDTETKEAIITALKYDSNPGVRREALKVLNIFPFDEDVKQTYISVILHDSSSAIRISAINQLLEASGRGVSFNREDRNLFEEMLLDDENGYIRSRARTVLEEYR
jgi:hypothetical protein